MSDTAENDAPILFTLHVHKDQSFTYVGPRLRPGGLATILRALADDPGLDESVTPPDKGAS